MQPMNENSACKISYVVFSDLVKSLDASYLFHFYISFFAAVLPVPF